MGIVLESLLCALVASLWVSSWFLGSLIITVREYFSEKTRYLRCKREKGERK